MNMNHSHSLASRPRLLGPVVLVLSMALAGCSNHNKPTQPEGVASADPVESDLGDLALGAGQHPRLRGFFPLAIGNRWTYKIDWLEMIRPDSPGTNIFPVKASVSQYIEQREMVGTEERFGREYVVEEQKTWGQVSITPPGPDTITYWVRYRQDRAGLYEADVSLDQPPNGSASHSTHLDVAAADIEEPLSSRLRQQGLQLTAAEAAAYDAAMTRLQEKMEVVSAALSWHGHRPPGHFGHRRGGVLDNELTRLKYPLRPGQSWTIREQPFLFTSRVIRHEMLRLPAGKLGGYRIQIESEAFGPHDRVFVWYGRAGLLRLSAHLETRYTDYTDPYGEFATLIIEEHSSLESFELVDR